MASATSTTAYRILPQSQSTRLRQKKTMVIRFSLATFPAVAASSDKVMSDRSVIRLGLPSKGRMATDTIELLKVSKIKYEIGN